MPDKSCLWRKFETIRNSTVPCAHFKNIYIWSCTMVSCHFGIRIARDKENWLEVFKNNVRKGFLANGSKGKTNRTKGRKESDSPGLHHVENMFSIRTLEFESSLRSFLFSLFTKHWGEEVREDEMDEVCSARRKIRTAYKILIRKSESKRHSGDVDIDEKIFR